VQVLGPDPLAVDLVLELADLGLELAADILPELLRGLTQVALIVV